MGTPQDSVDHTKPQEQVSWGGLHRRFGGWSRGDTLNRRGSETVTPVLNAQRETQTLTPDAEVVDGSCQVHGCHERLGCARQHP